MGTGRRLSELLLLCALVDLVACEPVPELEFNLPPEAGTAELGPAGATTLDEITLTYEEATDPDGDSPRHRILWTRDEYLVDVPPGTNFPSETASKGEVVRVEIIASDGEFESAAWGDSLIIGNAPPFISEISLYPVDATTEDVLSVVVEADDPDDDDVSLAYAWTRDGEGADVGNASEIGAEETLKGEVWSVTVTPSDGEVSGEPASAEVKIGNSAPTLGALYITADLSTGDQVGAVPIDADDPDGDDVTVTVEWLIDGVLAETDTLEPGETTALLDAVFVKGDSIQARAWGNDGFLDSNVVESEVETVANTAPTIDEVTITPSEGQESTTFECLVSGKADPDEDTVTIRYDWIVSGSSLKMNQSTLDGDDFDKHDTVSCKATPTDGFDDGDTLESDTANVVNTPPTLDSVSLNETSPVVTETISAAPSGFADDDGDSASYSFAWYVDGTKQSSTSTSLALTSYSRGDEVYCRITPNDGEEDGTAVKSDVATIANSPPSLSAASVTPSAPGTEDDLVLATGTTSDADGDDVDLSYEWYLNGSYLTDGVTTLDASYTVKGDRVYVDVTPSDGIDEGNTRKTSVVTIRNTAPVADGELLSSEPVESCDYADLDASSSSDVDDADTLTYSWSLTTRPSGSKATDSDFDDTTSETPLFFVDASGSWAFTLTVSDGSATDTDSVLMTSTLRADNTDPSAYPGSDATYTDTASCSSTGYAIVCDDCDDVEIDLDASGSTDDDGDPLHYAWTAASSTASTSLSGANTETPTLTISGLETDYGVTEEYDVEVQLIASDCAGGSDTETMTITVECTGI